MYDISQVQSEYKTKLIDADFAASLVKSNYRLHFGVGTGSSIYMDRALGKRLKTDTLLRGLEIQTEVAVRNDLLETFKATRDVNTVRFYSSHYTAAGMYRFYSMKNHYIGGKRATDSISAAFRLHRWIDMATLILVLLMLTFSELSEILRLS